MVREVTREDLILMDQEMKVHHRIENIPEMKARMHHMVVAEGVVESLVMLSDHVEVGADLIMCRIWINDHGLGGKCSTEWCYKLLINVTI